MPARRRPVLRHGGARGRPGPHAGAPGCRATASAGGSAGTARGSGPPGWTPSSRAWCDARTPVRAGPGGGDGRAGHGPTSVARPARPVRRHRLRHRDLGVCSRVLAPWLGAPVVFGGLGRDVAWGVPPVEHLRRRLSLPGAAGRRAGVRHREQAHAGCRLSPRLHNAAYRALGLPALYLPLPANEFPGSWRAICAGFEQLGLTFGGATVVAPFKEEALRLADTASVAAIRTDAANLLVREGGGWRASATDGTGAANLLVREVAAGGRVRPSQARPTCWRVKLAAGGRTPPIR